MISRIGNIVLVITLLVVMVSCSSPGNDASSNKEPTVQVTSLGDSFLSSNLKIKAEVIDRSLDPQRKIDIELYVDSDGDGQGLVGFGDTVIDVVVVSDMMYLVDDSGIVIGITDISARMLFYDVDITGQDDLTGFGFTCDSKGLPVSYSARRDNVSVDAQYAQSVNTFDTFSVAASTSLPLCEAVTYVIDYNTKTDPVVDEEVDTPNVEDFYINSRYGVTIDGLTFSVGDTCNPSTYFHGLTPEGLLTSSEYKEDTKVSFQHVSYLSSTGRTVFVLASNYVQSITTNANFEFLGINSGISDKDLRTLIGYRLTSAERENFIPLDSTLSVDSYKDSTYYCTIQNLKVEFRMEKSLLKELYIEQELDFKG